ncbi:MAG: Fur family transcriptional regulator [Pseudomonadota bacterium]
MTSRSQHSNIAFNPHDHRRCQTQLLSRADQHCKEKNLRLTSRRRQVLEILLTSHQPMGAYDILDQLNRDEKVAPSIVYRALEFLLEQGLIHRLESKNAFISCIHPGHGGVIQFLICRNCEQVAELESKNDRFLADAERMGFSVDHSIVEITGICAQCQKNG